VQDIKLYCKAVLEQRPWLHDPRCIPLSWRDVVPDDKPLKIGVMWHDELVRPTPPVLKALRETVEKLKKAGHEFVDWEPIGHLEAILQLVLSPVKGHY
jgi:amidase